MNHSYMAYIEYDNESDLYIGVIPSITGARTCAGSIDDLREKLKEVVILCLEEMDEEDKQKFPVFAGISQIEVAI